MNTILVVEDDDLVRSALAMGLEDEGFQIKEASNGEVALTILEGETAVALVISDVNMPGITGLTMAERIHQRWPHLPVILMSGRGIDSREIPDHYKFIRKPFGITILAALAREAIG